MRERNPVSGVLGWLLGERNRVSAVGIRSYLWNEKKKPGFWGVFPASKKPGFWGGYQELSVGSEQETRFLI